MYQQPITNARVVNSDKFLTKTMLRSIGCLKHLIAAKGKKLIKNNNNGSRYQMLQEFG